MAEIVCRATALQIEIHSTGTADFLQQIIIFMIFNTILMITWRVRPELTVEIAIYVPMRSFNIHTDMILYIIPIEVVEDIEKMDIPKQY